MALGMHAILLNGNGALSILLPEIRDTVFNMSVYFQGYGIFSEN